MDLNFKLNSGLNFPGKSFNFDDKFDDEDNFDDLETFNMKYQNQINNVNNNQLNYFENYKQETYNKNFTQNLNAVEKKTFKINFTKKAEDKNNFTHNNNIYNNITNSSSVVPKQNFNPKGKVFSIRLYLTRIINIMMTKPQIKKVKI